MTHLSASVFSLDNDKGEEVTAGLADDKEIIRDAAMVAVSLEKKKKRKNKEEIAALLLGRFAHTAG